MDICSVTVAVSPVAGGAVSKRTRSELQGRTLSKREFAVALKPKNIWIQQRNEAPLDRCLFIQVVTEACF